VGVLRVVLVTALLAACNQVLGIKDPVAGDATGPDDGRPDDGMMDGPDIDAPPACTTATAFGSPITSAVGGTGVGLAVAKFSNGADQDVAVAITTDTVILEGDSTGAFTAGQALTQPATAVVADDFDLIGVRKDLLLVTPTSAVVRQQRENGAAGTFDIAAQPLTGPFTNADAIAVAELGGSLVADVAIHDDAGTTPFVSLAAAGTFSRGTSVGAAGDKLVALTQIDKANDADALLIDAAGNLKIALSNGSDNFSAPTTITSGVTAAGVGDFDGDTFPDIVVAKAGGGLVFVQNAASPGTFVEQTGGPFVGIQGASILVGDVNGDGLDDVVVPNAVVLQCPTTRVFTQVEAIDATQPAVLVDVTGNGKLDLLRLSGTDLIARVQ